MLVYRPQHRLAAELLPIAEVALAGEGSAALDAGTNALILVGDGAALARARALLEQQDRALRNVVVHYASSTLSELSAAGVRVDWRVVAGDVRIGTLVGPGGGSAVRVRPEAERRTGERSFAGTLRILEGQSGEILTGSEVPVTTREAGPWGVRETTSFVAADSGFRVTPHVQGDGRVRLELSPFEGRIGATRGAVPVVERSAATTTLVLAPGEEAVLGGLTGASASREAGTRGARGSSAREETLLRVRVEVEGR